ncbi:MAG: MoaD/ThiS family protein [Promethearchaeota archaeon]
MRVDLKLFGQLRDIFKDRRHTIELNNSHGNITFKDIIKKIIELPEIDVQIRHYLLRDNADLDDLNDKNGAVLNPAVLILINDTDLRLLGGLDAKLNDGDVITLLPTIHGG